MKNIYANNSCYEDNDRFLKMMYHIEFEMSVLDLTEKRNNFYIQGDMARDRKFDRERMKEVANEQSLEIDIENLHEVMEEQNPDFYNEGNPELIDQESKGVSTDRTAIDAESKKSENRRLRMTPFLNHLYNVNKDQKRKVEK